MRRRNKCLFYMVLAVLPPAIEAASRWATEEAWPNKFQITLLSLNAIYQAALAAKAYYSDPNPSLATDRHGPNTEKTKT